MECEEEHVVIAVAEEVEWRRIEERKTRLVAAVEDGMLMVVSRYLCRLMPPSSHSFYAAPY